MGQNEMQFWIDIVEASKSIFKNTYFKSGVKKKCEF